MAKKNQKLNKDGLVPGELVSEDDYIKVSLAHRNNKNIKLETENTYEREKISFKK